MKYLILFSILFLFSCEATDTMEKVNDGTKVPVWVQNYAQDTLTQLSNCYNIIEDESSMYLVQKGQVAYVVPKKNESEAAMASSCLFLILGIALVVLIGMIAASLD